jgi:FimV-like protein
MLKGIELIELTKPYFYNENLQLMLAKTYISLGENKKARGIANDLIAKDLLKNEAKQLLEDIEKK